MNFGAQGGVVNGNGNGNNDIVGDGNFQAGNYGGTNAVAGNYRYWPKSRSSKIEILVHMT